MLPASLRIHPLQQATDRQPILHHPPVALTTQHPQTGQSVLRAVFEVATEVVVSTFLYGRVGDDGDRGCASACIEGVRGGGGGGERGWRRV